jgi:hypothetical protein
MQSFRALSLISALAVLAVASLAGCLHIAKTGDLPVSAGDVRFDEIAKKAARVDGGWNLQTDYEHYFEVDGTTADALHAGLEQALKRTRYEVKRSDKPSRTVIAQRSIMMAEWSSVAVAYYQASGAGFQVYIKNAITQDITGSWRKNRAKVIADTLCTEVMACKVRIPAVGKAGG